MSQSARNRLPRRCCFYEHSNERAQLLKGRSSRRIGAAERGGDQVASGPERLAAYDLLAAQPPVAAPSSIARYSSELGSITESSRDSEHLTLAGDAERLGTSFS
jgi:hypothetical protein